MRPIHGLPLHQHVTQGSPCMGEVALLQDHHNVSDMPIPEVKYHRCPCRRPATAPFDWAGPRHHPHRKRHLVGPWLFAEPVWIVSLRPQPPFSHDVLGLVVRHQWPLSKLLPALWAWDPPPLPLPLPLPLLLLRNPPLSRHPTSVGFVCPYYGRPASTEHHPHGLANVCPQSHPVK